MRACAVSKLEVCCRILPACRPMLVAAETEMNSATSPMNLRIRPLKNPPAPYAMTSTIGSTSIHVTYCFPRTARSRVRDARRPSLSEPGAVSFLQSYLDLSHHRVHFGVRQGALRASESQGKRDALVPLGDLSATVFVESASLLEKIAGRLLDRRHQGSCRDCFLHDHGQVAVDARETWKGLRAWDPSSLQHGPDIDLEADHPSVDPGPGRDGWMQLADVAELTAVHHDRGAAAGMKQLGGRALIGARGRVHGRHAAVEHRLEPVEGRAAVLGRQPCRRHGA